MKFKVYLFYPNSLKGLIICLVTLSRFSHAAIEYNGTLYDSSETRGSFGISDIKLAERKFICKELDGDLSFWYNRMKGTKYDWKGVLGWIFKFNDTSRYYCFEAIWEALLDVGIVTLPRPRRLSGGDLLKLLNNTK